MQPGFSHICLSLKWECLKLKGYRNQCKWHPWDCTYLRQSVSITHHMLCSFVWKHLMCNKKPPTSDVAKYWRWPVWGSLKVCSNATLMDYLAPPLWKSETYHAEQLCQKMFNGRWHATNSNLRPSIYMMQHIFLIKIRMKLYFADLVHINLVKYILRVIWMLIGVLEWFRF